MLRRPSIYAPKLFQSSCNSTFTNKSLLFFSSSSVITLHDSHSKPILSPFYNLLPPTQNPNNIVNLISSILRHKSSHFSILHNNDIKGILPHLGPHEISRVLLRCQSDHSSALTFFNWVKNDLNITPTVHNYCVVLHILAWSRVFSQAMELLAELIQMVEAEGFCVSSNEGIYENLVGCTENCNWNPVIFAMLVKAYVKVGMIDKGLETFRRNIEACFIPNVITCNCLLSGLSRFNYITQCWEVYEEMGRLGVHRNAYTFNIMTHVLCKDGDTDKVTGFLEKMEEEGFEPDLVTYNILINSYCKKRRLEDAFYMYKIMYVRGVIPNLITHTSLMNGLCEEGKVKEAHQLFHQMVHRGIDPDIVSYNTLVCGYCRQGKMQMCRSILYEMIGNRICPDSITCRLIVDGYARDGKLLSALNTVEELKRFRIKIPEEVYDYLIVALCKEGKPFAAKSFLHRICEDGYTPKMNTYNKLVESLCEFNNVEEALVLKSEIEKKNMKVNLAAYRAVINCLSREKRTLEAEGLLKEIITLGILPDVEISRALIKGYCEEDKVDKAVSILKLFVKEFQVYDTESYNAVVKVFCDGGNVTELMEFQDNMFKMGYVGNKLTCRYVIHGLQKTMELEEDHVILKHTF